MEEQQTIEQQIIAALRTIYDPEIPVNIYDLGLVYKIEVDDQQMVHIVMIAILIFFMSISLQFVDYLLGALRIRALLRSLLRNIFDSKERV